MSQPATTASPWHVVAAMAVLGAVALLVGILVGGITYSLLGVPLSLSPTGAAGQLLINVGTYAAIATVGGLYLLRHELSLAYVRYRRPTPRDLGLAAVTIVGLLALSIAIPLVVDRLGLPIAEHGVAETIEGNPTIALAFLPVSILVVGPAEEFLYRGIIQTRLREIFDARSAVAIAAILFASIHFLAYRDPGNVPGTIVTLTLLVLPLGAILGAVYERTDNLVVPALSHGFYNAITFGLAYANVVGWI